MKLPEKYYQQQCVDQKYFSITDKENNLDLKFYLLPIVKEKDRDLGLLKEMREF